MELYKLSSLSLIILLVMVYAVPAALNFNCNIMCVHGLKANQNKDITASVFYKNKLLTDGAFEIVLNNKYLYNGQTSRSGYFNASAPLSIGINRLRLSYDGSFSYFYILYFGEFSNYILLICCVLAFAAIADAAKRLSSKRDVIFYLHNENLDNLAKRDRALQQLLDDAVSKFDRLKISPKILCEYGQIKDVICKSKKFVIDEFSIAYKIKNFEAICFNSNVFLCKKASEQALALSVAYENAINFGSMKILKNTDDFIQQNNIVIEKNGSIDIEKCASFEKGKIKIVTSMGKREMADKIICECAGLRLLFLCKSAEVIR